jgi:hypothetical protein
MFIFEDYTNLHVHGLMQLNIHGNKKKTTVPPRSLMRVCQTKPVTFNDYTTDLQKAIADLPRKAGNSGNILFNLFKSPEIFFFAFFLSRPLRDVLRYM